MYHLRPPVPQDRDPAFWWLIYKTKEGEKIPCCMLWSPSSEGWAPAGPSLERPCFQRLPPESFVLIRRADTLRPEEIEQEMSSDEISRRKEADLWRGLF